MFTKRVKTHQEMPNYRWFFIFNKNWLCISQHVYQNIPNIEKEKCKQTAMFLFMCLGSILAFRKFMRLEVIWRLGSIPKRQITS